jgi:hypothetical protein
MRKVPYFRHISVPIPPIAITIRQLAGMQKIIIAACALAAMTAANAQNLQLHYDLRHTISPAANPKNFPTLYFECWKMRDSGQHKSRHISIKPGAFFLKTEADLLGSGNNIGKFFMQVSQSFRAWKPKIFLQFQYSGGNGITEPKQYSYYITNTCQAGAELPFHWQGAWLTADLDYRYVSYPKPTNDPIFTLYWYRGFFHYKLEFAGDFSCWTENRNHGDETTAGQKGKRGFFFAEPQVWYSLTKTFSIGAKLNCYYHVNIPADSWQAYPTLAIRTKV